MQVEELGKSATLMQGEFFRVQTISKFVRMMHGSIIVTSLDANEGLGIEQRLDDEHYYVVGFVTPDREKHRVIYEDVAFRFLAVLSRGYDDPHFIAEFRDCVEFAKNTLQDILDKEE